MTGPSPLDQLSSALRAHARGLLCAEAAVELLISQQSWLDRRDFVDEFVDRADSMDPQPSGSVAMAVVDWVRARAALDAGTLPCSSGEAKLLAIAASLGEGIPVDLRDALTGLDASNIELVRRMVSHAADHRP